ncbi:MAG TPA: GAF domain-containing protein, partial [Anaerolineae bacterium]|nr:GAF domain-containing protein [Anaerolineae bacterium]
MKSAKSATRPRSRSVERAASKPATESRRQTPVDLTGPSRPAPRRRASVELAGVLDNIPTSVLVLDRTGVIVWVNSAVTNDFGCARESLLGRSLLQLIIDDEQEHFQHWLTQVVAAESATHLSFEAYIHRADNLIDRGRFSGIYAAAQQQVIVTYYRLNVLEDADIDLSIRAARLEASNAIAAIVSQSLDPDVALRMALHKTLEVIRAESGVVMLVEEATGDLIFKAQVGWRPVTSISASTRVKTDEGLAGLVAHTDQPIVVDDVQTDPRIKLAGFREIGVRSMMLAPMHARAKVIGVLTIMDYSPRRFTVEDVNVLSAAADQMGIGLANTQLYQAEQRQRRLAEALSQVASTVNSTLNLESVIDLIVDQLQRVVAYDIASLVLKQQNHFRLVMKRDVSETDRSGREFEIETWPTAQLILETHRTIYIQDVQADPRWVWLGPGSRTRSWLGVPLLNKTDELLGILLIDN